MGKDKELSIEVVADYKDVGSLLEQMIAALDEFGIEMSELPDTKGSDTYGFVFRYKKSSQEPERKGSK